MDKKKEHTRPAGARAIPPRVAARDWLTIAGISKGRNPRIPSTVNPARLAAWTRLSSKGAKSAPPAPHFSPCLSHSSPANLEERVRNERPQRGGYRFSQG